MEERDDQQFLIEPHQADLPKLFYSDATGEPLKECIMCGKQVYNESTSYVIEKAFRYHKKFDLHETIFEYAICMPCYEKMSAQLSKESMAKLQSYFNDHLNFLLGRHQLLMDKNYNLDEWLGTCAIKGTDIKDSSEYQVCCQCDGPNMIFSHLPIAISEEALMEITEQLSAQTKNELDRFQDEFLGLPPDLKELFKDRPILMV